MTNHLNFLVEHNLLTRGGRFLTSTDGTAKQYKSSTSIYFMSMLSQAFKAVVDRSICCPGHGKNPVDAINGVDKNTIKRWSNRSVQLPEEAMENQSTSIQVQSYNNTE